MVETDEKASSESAGYTMKIAHLAVTKNQHMEEDKVILDSVKQAEEIKKRKEEELLILQLRKDVLDLK